MTASSQRLADYLAHIVEAIDRIERYTEAMDQAAFLASPLVQDAVIRNIEIIGEASHSVETRAPDFAAQHPELPLAFAHQMRNAVAHGHFKVDWLIVWNTIVGDLPGFRQAVQRVASGLAPTSTPKP